MDREALLSFMMDTAERGKMLMERDGTIAPVLVMQHVSTLDILQLPNFDKSKNVGVILAAMRKILAKNFNTLQGVVFCVQVRPTQLTNGYVGFTIEGKEGTGGVMLVGASQSHTLCYVVPFKRDELGVVMLDDEPVTVTDKVWLPIFDGLWGNSQRPAFN